MKRLATIAAVRDHCDGLGIDLPIDDHVDPDGILASPIALGTKLIAPNRFAVLPMEGWDADRAGRPTDLVRRRWRRFGASGCGLVWGEAMAVRPDGRANPNQLVLDEATADDVAALRPLLAPDQVVGVQLTHSGRWSRPDGTPAPRTAFAHPTLDAPVGATRASVMSDDELDTLVDAYVAAAVLAAEAGFDFVDIKHCHGYLLHELLAAVDRPGRYGGDLEGRTRFLRAVVEEIRRRAPALSIAVRLSAFDFAPHAEAGRASHPSEPVEPYHRAFGGDGTGTGIDLTEPHQFVDIAASLGATILGTTAGCPYTTPHIQRPAFFPPTDGYPPPEDPLVGVTRQLRVTAELTAHHPTVATVAGGYSYLQQWLPNVAQAVITAGGASMIGVGRLALSYPHFAADVLAGRRLDPRLICRTFSDCTSAPRNGLISGCYPLDPFYRDRPERLLLARAKQATR